MKPANFPARKDARRIAAVERMQGRSQSAEPEAAAKRSAVIANTLAKVSPTARDKRSKKDRSAHGRRKSA